MNTRIQTSADSEISKGAYISVCTELIPDALPKVENSSESENSDTGVSAHFVPLPKDILLSRRAVRQPHWYDYSARLAISWQAVCHIGVGACCLFDLIG